MAAINTSSERPPIVAVLGHVDHGKSTLLDYIRKANTVAHEAGGITQHVAAYEVEHSSKETGVTKKVTFIDTPGHAAFKTIRSRGANVADVAVLVVAADDGVKAQTLEALQSILDAKTPFVVAINKIDKPNADVARTQSSLLEHGVFLEKFGGDVPWTAISAKSGEGVDTLLDLILLVAELEDLKGDSAVPATGYVIEAHRDKKRGIAATLIITNGTLRNGEFVRAGAGISPVRIMENHLGHSLREATFSSPIQLVGFDELPDVGTEFQTHKSKKAAEVARTIELSERAAQLPLDVSTDPGDIFQLPIIIRADVTGSLDALMMEIPKVSDEHARIRIVQSGIGAITEDDVSNALSSEALPAVIIGFNVAPERIAESFARERGVTIETFDIIYKLTERLAELLKEKRPVRTLEEVIGRAKILKVFSTRKDEHLIGASIQEGKLTRNCFMRIVRRGTEIDQGKIVSLQSNRQTVDKVEKEGEFGGMIVSEFPPMQGDIIECVIKVTK